MARYIDANEAMQIINNYAKAIDYDCDNCKVVIDAIKDIVSVICPTADVVEVKCRCKDCKHYIKYGRTSLVFDGKNIQCGWCMLRAKTDEEHRMLPDDFCSYGERR